MKLIVLDRDGVINEDSDNYIRSAGDWQPLPGSIDAIARLSTAGFTVVIASNQSGIARGLFSTDALEAMNQKLLGLVENAGGAIGGIYYCTHGPDDGCDCRKPLPGLLDAISADFGETDLNGVPVVGDSLRDLQAALTRGCMPLLVRTGKGKATERQLLSGEHTELRATRVFDDLAAATDYLLGQ